MPLIKEETESCNKVITREEYKGKETIQRICFVGSGGQLRCDSPQELIY